MRIFFTDSAGNPKFGFGRSSSYRPTTRYMTTTKINSGASKNDPPTLCVSPFRTTLFCHVLNRDWELVLKRARTHSNEILLLDSRTGDLPLHAACRLNPPVPVVKALLEPNTNTAYRGFAISKKPGTIVKQEGSPASVQSLQLLHYNMNGWTALHVAASSPCSPQVLQVLVEHAPDSISQLTSKTKRTPMHCACSTYRGLNRDGFSYLLQASLAAAGLHLKNKTTPENPTQGFFLLCLRDSMGQTPMALLFQRYSERVKQVCQRMDTLSSTVSREEALRLVQSELGPLWERARSMVELLSASVASGPKQHLHHPNCKLWIGEGLFMNKFGGKSLDQGPLQSEKLVHTQCSKSSRRFRLVHASVALVGFGCPPEMVRLSISLYPREVSERDEYGRLPLHIAAIAYAEYQQAQQEEEMSVDRNNNSSDTRIHGNLDTASLISEATSTAAASSIAGFSNRKSVWDQVFDMLLQQFPQGARMSVDESADELPLALAMSKMSLYSCFLSCWRHNGLERLMHAYPPALHLVLDQQQLRVPLCVGANNPEPHVQYQGANILYPQLLSLLLARDHETIHYTNGRRGGRSLRLSRSIRLQSGSPRRTPLELARISAVFQLLQTKPEMVDNGRTFRRVTDTQKQT